MEGSFRFGLALSLLLLGIGMTAPAAAEPVGQASPQAATPGDGIVDPGARARYDACLALTGTAPEKAFEAALAWHDQGGGLAADHCAAVALVALGQYREGAVRLEKLAAALDKIGSGLTPAVLDQAANSWLLAGRPERAAADAGAALKLDPSSALYHIDRARALAALGRYQETLPDLDAAIRLAPQDATAYAFRASARRHIGDLTGALADANAALTRDPDSTAALLERGILRRMAGNRKGAEADWLRILTLAPGTSVAKAAQSDLQSLALDH